MNPTHLRLVAGGAAIGLAVGIGLTYVQYRGTDLSRVPRVATRQVSSTASPLTPDAAPGEAALPPAISPDLPSPTPPTSSSDVVDELRIYPTVTKGMRTPFDLWRYYGRGVSSFESPVLPMRFEQWLDFHRRQKPSLMADVDAYMAKRFMFSGDARPGEFMSGGKPIMQGPIARLANGVDSFDQLAALRASQIRQRDVFPYKPLAHPLQTSAHMVFPDSWVKAHPGHERIDIDMDFPDAYLPEFPPPMYLTTHKELGDVTNGREVTLENFFEIFDGLITPEQMEGLKELLRPSPTTWFNHTDHRVTAEPSKGVACFDCHVNGHTNGAFELGPDARPNMARLRTDTPTMRGN
ncbi:MAG: hypothetical protein KDA61_09460, partial [Planctomycetales bacterium]|nr:hypothetical protein [Planctomycetales bacterium]